jgi:hypothetical protein
MGNKGTAAKPRVYPQSKCKKCRNERDKVRVLERKQENNGVDPVRARTNAKLSRMRADGQFVDRWIYIDARSSDRKSGRENDLTREFIRESIKLGCRYCGDVSSRMTLDRIDNDIGHLQSNVVPACFRCNLTRRDMPYAAWLLVAKGMREARETGLFGTWPGNNFRDWGNRKKDTLLESNS